VGAILFLAGLQLLFATGLLALRFIDPPTTGVQIQRRIESLFTRGAYKKRQTFVPLDRISPQLQHAVIAAEDGNFYKHYGIDWGQVQDAIEESAETGEPPRGASTIPQQCSSRISSSPPIATRPESVQYAGARGGDDSGATSAAELVSRVRPGRLAPRLRRVPRSSAALSREQSARLAAILPAPRRRKPERMNQYSAIIQDRMRRLGW
jgi:monofunctional biosynthetic peptidoglycan transglycosylase